tara:strand:- start:1176 stop:1880 length:705 start_codon:yes stop_codon:yes gene_type:complete
MNNTLVSKQLSMGVLRLSCLELFLLEQKKLNTQILYTCCQINKIMTVIANSFQEVLNWAINPFKNGRTHTLNKTKELTITKQRNIAQKDEKEWGNQIIGQKNNGNWTTLLGQGIVFETLKKLGENPRKPEKKNGYSPDWETDQYIYEVKTRSWTTSGTAGEKVLGNMYKYSEIPELYGKPLKIVCVAYQEYELAYGPTKIFGEVCPSKKKFLGLAKSLNIEYIKFSDLVSQLNY